MSKGLRLYGLDTPRGVRHSVMKPLKTELQDDETLRELGSASVQIVHDLKNQLNGLKLYATFLRKRFEKSDRPPDELETIAKLIAGLERAAGDMTLLVRLGRKLELRCQSATDLARVLAVAASGHRTDEVPGTYSGFFDTESLTDALQIITHAGRAQDAQEANDAGISLRREETDEGAAQAVIEWRGVAQSSADDDFFHNFSNSSGLRLVLAAKVIKAHGGEVEQAGDLVRARLPLET